MPAISQIRNFHLKVVSLVHFAFIAVTLIGSWTPKAYLFYNSILIIFLVLSMYIQQEESIQMAIAVNVLAIIFDVLVLVFKWPTYHEASEQFSVAVAILHLLYRPLSLHTLLKVLGERTGSSGLISEVFGGGRNPSSYEDIDRIHPSQSTPQSGGDDFASAQQI